jgi:hypothetical protein
MSPEAIFVLTLASRMAIVAALVLTASIITERFGPVIGALIASLPISAGPSFVFLALDHDSAFLAESALASLPVNAATIFLLLTYAVLAQRHGMVIAIGASVAVWLVLSFIMRQFEWTLAGGIVLNAITFAICIPLLEPYRHVKRMPPITPTSRCGPRWWRHWWQSSSRRRAGSGQGSAAPSLCFQSCSLR